MKEVLFYHEKYIDELLEKCIDTARRCRAKMFVNALSREAAGWRNTTYCYDQDGVLRGKIF